MFLLIKHYVTKGLFKYYVSKEVGGWGQKMAITGTNRRPFDVCVLALLNEICKVV